MILQPKVLVILTLILSIQCFSEGYQYVIKDPVIEYPPCCTQFVEGIEIDRIVERQSTQRTTAPAPLVRLIPTKLPALPPKHLTPKPRYDMFSRKIQLYNETPRFKGTFPTLTDVKNFKVRIR